MPKMKRSASIPQQIESGQRPADLRIITAKGMALSVSQPHWSLHSDFGYSALDWEQSNWNQSYLAWAKLRLILCFLFYSGVELLLSDREFPKKQQGKLYQEIPYFIFWEICLGSSVISYLLLHRSNEGRFSLPAQSINTCTYIFQKFSSGIAHICLIGWGWDGLEWRDKNW